MHEQIKGLYLAPTDYCASDGLLDEWMTLIPNVNDVNHKMHEQIYAFRKTQQPELN